MKEESLVTVKIFSIDDNKIKVLTNHGVIGLVYDKDVLENEEYNELEVSKKFKINDYVQAKIKKIFFDSVKITFSLREDVLNNHADYLKKNRIFENFDLADDNSFLIVREDDYPQLQV